MQSWRRKDIDFTQQRHLIVPHFRTFLTIPCFSNYGIKTVMNMDTLYIKIWDSMVKTFETTTTWLVVISSRKYIVQ